ncbi:MAG: LptF/LptG family permease [Rhodospirillaceae bacterium]
MVQARTLLIYVARNYLNGLVGAAMVVGTLLLLFDIIEMMRQTAAQDVGMDTVFFMAFYRLPMAFQNALPFVFMAGAMLVFWRLARSSELVVIRSAGFSVWQFLAPVLLLVFGLGVVAVTLLNPIAADFYVRYETMERELEIGDITPMKVSKGGMWLRESFDEHQVVLHAPSVRQRNETFVMDNVVVFVYEEETKFLRRIDATEAELIDGQFVLRDVSIVEPGQLPFPQPSYTLETGLTLTRIEQNFSPPDTVSFWELPSHIEFFEAAGFSAHVHEMHLYSLIAGPFLFIAMVLVAAVFSLKPSQRSVNWLFRVIGCVAAGFAVYFFSRITYTLGSSQTLPVILAAWSPAVVTTFTGLAMLFHLEDG